LVIRAPGTADDGLFARDADGRPLCWNRAASPVGAPSGAMLSAQGIAPEGAPTAADAVDISPAVVGEYTLPDGRTAIPVFHLVAERYLDPQYAPDAVAERCGVPADTIRRIA